MLAKHLGQHIKDRRKELGIRRPHLAELAGISTKIYCIIELGKAKFTLEVLNSLTEVLGMQV